MTAQGKIKEIAATYSVSERTARRYLGRGQLPAPMETRRLGMDGKYYPYPDRVGYLSPLHKPLVIARSNIRRAARAGEFREGDLAILQGIVLEGKRLLANWESVSGSSLTPTCQREEKTP